MHQAPERQFAEVYGGGPAGLPGVGGGGGGGEPPLGPFSLAPNVEHYAPVAQQQPVRQPLPPVSQPHPPPQLWGQPEQEHPGPVGWEHGTPIVDGDERMDMSRESNF